MRFVQLIMVPVILLSPLELLAKSLPLISPERSVFQTFSKKSSNHHFFDVGSSGLELGKELNGNLRVGLGVRENWTKYKKFRNPTRQSLWSRGISTHLAWHLNGPRRQGVYLKASVGYDRWVLYNSFKYRDDQEILGESFFFRPRIGYQWTWSTGFNIKIGTGSELAIHRKAELEQKPDWDDLWFTTEKEGQIIARLVDEPIPSYDSLQFEASLGFTL